MQEPASSSSKDPEDPRQPGPPTPSAGFDDAVVAGSNALVSVVGFYTKAIDELRQKLHRSGLAVSQLQQLLKQSQREGTKVVDEATYVRMMEQAIELQKLKPVLTKLDAFLAECKLNGLPETAYDVALGTLYDCWMAVRSNGTVEPPTSPPRGGQVRGAKARPDDGHARPASVRGKVPSRKRQG